MPISVVLMGSTLTSHHTTKVLTPLMNTGNFFALMEWFDDHKLVKTSNRFNKKTNAFINNIIKIGKDTTTKGFHEEQVKTSCSPKSTIEEHNMGTPLQETVTLDCRPTLSHKVLTHDGTTRHPIENVFRSYLQVRMTWGDGYPWFPADPAIEEAYLQSVTEDQDGKWRAEFDNLAQQEKPLEYNGPSMDENEFLSLREWTGSEEASDFCGEIRERKTAIYTSWTTDDLYNLGEEMQIPDEGQCGDGGDKKVIKGGYLIEKMDLGGEGSDNGTRFETTEEDNRKMIGDKKPTRSETLQDEGHQKVTGAKDIEKEGYGGDAGAGVSSRRMSGVISVSEWNLIFNGDHK